jgi:hypothetical protein
VAREDDLTVLALDDMPAGAAGRVCALRGGGRFDIDHRQKERRNPICNVARVHQFRSQPYSR